LSEIRVKAIKPLPEPLPEGEHVLWQNSPSWKPFSRRVFQLDKIALYFLIIVAWVATSAFLENGDAMALLRSLAWSVPPALGVVGLLAFIAWLYARTTVYTITNKRVVIQSGLALPSAVNLPFSKVSSADMKTFSDETGDIELTMSGPRLLYSMLWPNVRLLRLNRPTPMLRALEQPQSVAEILGNALAADQPSETAQTAPEREDVKSDRRRPVTS
jgi:hypothetical protein